MLAARLGNRWTYAGDAVAPGQMPAARLLRDFGFRRIRPDAALYGVVGKPIAHSLSPAMHNAGFDALGLNAVYLALEARDADDFVTFARATGLRGASITAPFKVALMNHVDELDAAGAASRRHQHAGRARRPVDRRQHRRRRLPRAAREPHPPETGARVSARRGRGGARGRRGARRQGAEVTICARRPDAAAAIADLANGESACFPPPAGTWDVLVNATTAGSDADPENPMAGARSTARSCSTSSTAGRDAAARAAREAGCLTIGGIEMLVAQAERQFELWTGQRPPAACSRHAPLTPSSEEPALTAQPRTV